MVEQVWMTIDLTAIVIGLTIIGIARLIGLNDAPHLQHLAKALP